MSFIQDQLKNPKVKNIFKVFEEKTLVAAVNAWKNECVRRIYEDWSEGSDLSANPYEHRIRRDAFDHVQLIETYIGRLVEFLTPKHKNEMTQSLKALFQPVEDVLNGFFVSGETSTFVYPSNVQTYFESTSVEPKFVYRFDSSEQNEKRKPECAEEKNPKHLTKEEKQVLEYWNLNKSPKNKETYTLRAESGIRLDYRDNMDLWKAFQMDSVWKSFQKMRDLCKEFDKTSDKTLLDELVRAHNDMEHNICKQKPALATYQKFAAEWLLRCGRILCWFTVGAGKTGTAMEAVSRVIRDPTASKWVKHIIVAAPTKTTLETTWFRELKKWLQRHIKNLWVSSANVPEDQIREFETMGVQVDGHKAGPQVVFLTYKQLNNWINPKNFSGSDLESDVSDSESEQDCGKPCKADKDCQGRKVCSPQGWCRVNDTDKTSFKTKVAHRILGPDFTPDRCFFILDEAHNLHKNQREFGNIVRFLGKRKPDHTHMFPNMRVMMLSATPVDKDYTDLFPLLQILRIESFQVGKNYSLEEVGGLLKNYVSKVQFVDNGVSNDPQRYTTAIKNDIYVKPSEIQRMNYIFKYRDLSFQVGEKNHENSPWMGAISRRRDIPKAFVTVDSKLKTDIPTIEKELKRKRCIVCNDPMHITDSKILHIDGEVKHIVHEKCLKTRFFCPVCKENVNQMQWRWVTPKEEDLQVRSDGGVKTAIFAWKNDKYRACDLWEKLPNGEDVVVFRPFGTTSLGKVTDFRKGLGYSIKFQDGVELVNVPPYYVNRPFKNFEAEIKRYQSYLQTYNVVDRSSKTLQVAWPHAAKMQNGCDLGDDGYQERARTFKAKFWGNPSAIKDGKFTDKIDYEDGYRFLTSGRVASVDFEQYDLRPRDGTQINHSQIDASDEDSEESAISDSQKFRVNLVDLSTTIFSTVKSVQQCAINKRMKQMVYAETNYVVKSLCKGLSVDPVDGWKWARIHAVFPEAKSKFKSPHDVVWFLNGQPLTGTLLEAFRCIQYINSEKGPYFEKIKKQDWGSLKEQPHFSALRDLAKIQNQEECAKECEKIRRSYIKQASSMIKRAIESLAKHKTRLFIVLYTGGKSQKNDMVNVFNQDVVTNSRGKETVANLYGELVNTIILQGGGTREGLSLFEVGTVHICGSPVTPSDETQTIGRALRMCAHKNHFILGGSEVKRFEPIEVYTYLTAEFDSTDTVTCKGETCEAIKTFLEKQIAQIKPLGNVADSGDVAVTTPTKNKKKVVFEGVDRPWEWTDGWIKQRLPSLDHESVKTLFLSQQANGEERYVFGETPKDNPYLLPYYLDRIKKIFKRQEDTSLDTNCGILFDRLWKQKWPKDVTVKGFLKSNPNLLMKHGNRELPVEASLDANIRFLWPLLETTMESIYEVMSKNTVDRELFAGFHGFSKQKREQQLTDVSEVVLNIIKKDPLKWWRSQDVLAKYYLEKNVNKILPLHAVDTFLDKSSDSLLHLANPVQGHKDNERYFRKSTKGYKLWNEDGKPTNVFGMIPHCSDQKSCGWDLPIKFHFDDDCNKKEFQILRMITMYQESITCSFQVALENTDLKDQEYVWVDAETLKEALSERDQQIETDEVVGIKTKLLQFYDRGFVETLVSKFNECN